MTVVDRETGEEDPLVRDEFDVKAGHTYDFFAIREEVSEVEADLMALGYMQNRIRLERQVEGDKANLTLRVRRGPLVEMRFAGLTPPKATQDEVRRQWHRGVFDKQRADDGAEALREWLMTDGYLQPKVSYTIDDSTPDRRRVTFQVEAGPHYDKVLLAFDGASGIDPDELDAIVDSQDLERQLFTDPAGRHRAAGAVLPRSGLSLRRDRRAAHRVSGLDRARRARGSRGSEVHGASAWRSRETRC